MDCFHPSIIYTTYSVHGSIGPVAYARELRAQVSVKCQLTAEHKHAHTYNQLYNEGNLKRPIDFSFLLSFFTFSFHGFAPFPFAQEILVFTHILSYTHTERWKPSRGQGQSGLMLVNPYDGRALG